jgi:outer membrane protein assembly factor BamE
MNYIPGVYTIDIQQGNIIDQAMIDQLRPGMNKRQVLYIMGSPMLDDVFHKNRWDYLYSNQPDGEDRVQKQISLFFENDQIVGIQGDFRPSAVPVIKTSGETTVDVPKRDLEKTLWEKITGLIGYDELDATSKTDKTDAKKQEGNDPPL